MNRYRVGIVGYGWAAEAHIAALNATSRCQVTALCSARPLNAAELSAQHRCPLRVFPTLEAMLADPDLDVVDLCSYHHLHARQAIAAARAGKHLIIEKPIALNLKDSRAMLAAVKRAGVRTCVCFEMRWSTQFQATRSLIASGLLGDLHYGEVDYYHGIGPWYREYEWITPKKACGSSLIAAGCHAMDILLFCLGTDVQSVFSSATQSKHPLFRKYEYPTSTVTTLNFKSGRVGKVASVIDCWQPYYFHTHLVGSEGSLLDNRFHSNRLPGLNKHAWSQLSFKPVDSGDVSDHPYQTQFQAFFDALDRGEEMPHTSLADAARTHEVIFAADRSAATRKPVKL
jgi:UDP-N-acetyl-2-amino-2-deoxyglucuronate dehydrogenase